MRRRVYIETTAVSYLVARPSRDVVLAGRQAATRDFWAMLPERFEPYVSALVHEEAQRGDAEQARRRTDAIRTFAMLDVDADAERLAAELLAASAVPASCPEDAVHLAIAAVNGMDILVTWNFAHLNNPFTRRAVRRAIEAAGFVSPEVCSPEELLEAEP
jgi:predicted nucleic acid-binding protein